MSPPRPRPTAPFAELRARSAFSLLDGASTPEALVTRAAKVGLSALAVADVYDLGGAVRLQLAAEAAGLHVVHGLTVYVPRADGPPHRPDTVTLLAENRRGWRTLCRLVTRARHLDGRPRGEPRTPLDALTTATEGLTVLVDAFADSFGPLAEAFGDRLAVPVERHGLEAERRRTREAIARAEAAAVPWVPVNAPRYAAPSDRVAHDVLTCLRHGTTVDEAGTRLRPNGEWYLKGPRAMARMWPDDLDALERTVTVAARCRFDVRDLAPALPRHVTADGTDPALAGLDDDGRLRHLVEAGARARWGGRYGAAHRRQLAHELRVIGDLGLAGYFLIVHDIVAFARREQILAQGRGSAANSAVCYCLGITAVDPVAMGLLFERFLSEGRTDPPDIDVDLGHMDRERVLQHVYERWGRRHAAMVCTTITWRGRSAVRDVARVLGFDADVAGRLATQVGHGEASEAAERLRGGGLAAAGLDPGAPRARALIDAVARLDRLPRHRSIHTGGFVLTADPLDGVVPIEDASMAGRTVIQWDKDDLAPVGLIKIDLLGLGILTVLDKALRSVRESRGVSLDLEDIPMDDVEVYRRISRGDTVGVFQLESRAQMATLPRVQPERFYDLVVQVAIIRPGPIQGDMVHPYIRRRRGEEPVTFLHPDLEPVLARTLGVPLFQEQGMRVAVVMAGFTPAQADRMRKIMGWKRAGDHLQDVLRDLWAGMMARGVSEDVAFRIVRQLEGFASYGFPESHAASFALLGYASAWLKHHYAPEFLAALLNSQPMGFYDPATLVADGQRQGVAVRPVDLLYSRWECTLEHDVSPPAVRLGLRLVRGLSTAARDTLEQATAHERLGSLDDLVHRTRLDRRALTSLAHAGAFRSMWPGRRQALWALLDRVRARGLPLAPPAPADEAAAAALPSMSALEATAADYASVGVTTGPHLMAHFRAALDRLDVTPSDGLTRLARAAAAAPVDPRPRPPGERPPAPPVTVAGVVICRQRPESAKGVCFLTLEDEHGLINVVVMPDLFDANRVRIGGARALVVSGRLEHHRGVLSVLAERVQRFEADDAPPARFAPTPPTRDDTDGEGALGRRRHHHGHGFRP